VWDAATSKYLCDCLPGYVWNATRTACDVAPPDCSQYYANTKAVWDPATSKYLCDCLPGYVWNATRTACDLSAPDCSQYYANTKAVWDAATSKYLCDCLPGYVWNATRTACVSSAAPDCASYYPNSYAAIDPATNQYACYCLTGHEWNATRTACVLSGNRDTVIVNPAQVKTGECNISYGSGANEPEQYTIDVKKATGTLTFTYSTYTVKDRIHIYYANGKVFDSGCVGASGSQNFTLNGSSSVFRIIVDPLCDPTESNTAWDWHNIDYNRVVIAHTRFVWYSTHSPGYNCIHIYLQQHSKRLRYLDNMNYSPELIVHMQFLWHSTHTLHRNDIHIYLSEN